MFKVKKIFLVFFLPIFLVCGKEDNSNKLFKGIYDFSKVEKIVNNAIEDSAFPGAVVLVEKNGKILFEKAFGHFTYDKNSRPDDFKYIV